MHVEDEPLGDRQVTGEAVREIGRFEVPLDLNDVRRSRPVVQLSLKHLGQGGLGSFDACAGQRFAAQVGPDQGPWVLDECAETLEVPESGVGVGQSAHERRAESEVARDRPRHVVVERPAIPGLTGGSTEGGVGEVVGAHGINLQAKRSLVGSCVSRSHVRGSARPNLQPSDVFVGALGPIARPRMARLRRAWRRKDVWPGQV